MEETRRRAHWLILIFLPILHKKLVASQFQIDLCSKFSAFFEKNNYFQNESKHAVITLRIKHF